MPGYEKTLKGFAKLNLSYCEKKLGNVEKSDAYFAEAQEGSRFPISINKKLRDNLFNAYDAKDQLRKGHMENALEFLDLVKTGPLDYCYPKNNVRIKEFYKTFNSEITNHIQQVLEKSKNENNSNTIKILDENFSPKSKLQKFSDNLTRIEMANQAPVLVFQVCSVDKVKRVASQMAEKRIKEFDENPQLVIDKVSKFRKMLNNERAKSLEDKMLNKADVGKNQISHNLA
jgi:hypothetical protein